MCYGGPYFKVFRKSDVAYIAFPTVPISRFGTEDDACYRPISPCSSSQ